MQIHHHVPHGLKFKLDPAEMDRLALGEIGIGDEADWEEINQYDEEAFTMSRLCDLDD